MPDLLQSRLKRMLVDTLKLDDIDPENIPDDEGLFNSNRFGLDSIDALELVVAVEKEFGVKIASSEEAREALSSIAHLAAFIRARAPKGKLPS